MTFANEFLEAAIEHHHAGRFAEAETAYRRALAADPHNVDALHFLGFLAFQLGRHGEAAELISQALSRNAANVPAHVNLGNVFQAQGRPAQAVACYRKALALAPDDAAIHYALGNALVEPGEKDEAIACYRRSLQLRPDFPEAHANLGTALKEQGRLNEAAASYREALRLAPDYVIAHFNLGIAFRDQGRREEAIACFERALQLNPGLAETHYCLGHVLREENRLQEALSCFRKALSLDPELAEARWSIAMSRVPAVAAAGDDPARSRAAFSSELEELERWFDGARVAQGARAVGAQQPFALAYQEENNRDLLRRYGNLCARLMAHWFDRQALPPPGKRGAAGIIRVGVVSQYFHSHSVWNAIVKGWFQQLDRERFALQAFHVGVDQDEETVLAKSRAAHFEQGTRGLRQWVEAILGQRLDVLIYPEIGMDAMTLKLASLRLAPVQVATWGHPETTGLPTIDYFLSAEDLEPAGAQANYTERLVALPHLGCYFESSQVDPLFPAPGDWGIDPDSPLLVCPGTPFKYAPQQDGVFTQIARRLGRCRFVFFSYSTPRLSEQLRRRLEAAFRRDGLAFDDYVSFIPWLTRPAFHGLMQRADVYLDTIGFSGFNSALQALECGLPVVTREGRFLRGRLASGILKRIGLQELVAATEQEYVSIAARLVEGAGYDETIRERIAANRGTVFRDPAPIRALEDFLLELSGKR